jgi:hypothetical protein
LSQDPGRRKKRLAAAAAGIAVLIVLGGIGFLFWYTQPPEDMSKFFKLPLVPDVTKPLFEQHHNTIGDLIGNMSFAVAAAIAVSYGVLLAQQDPFALKLRDRAFSLLKKLVVPAAKLLWLALTMVGRGLRAAFRPIGTATKAAGASSFGAWVRRMAREYEFALRVSLVCVGFIPMVFLISHSLEGRLGYVLICIVWVMFVASRTRKRNR